MLAATQSVKHVTGQEEPVAQTATLPRDLNSTQDDADANRELTSEIRRESVTPALTQTARNAAVQEKTNVASVKMRPL